MVSRRTTCQMPTDVMEPTIPRGAEVVLDTSHYYNTDPQRWDIVAFFTPELESQYYDLGRKRVPNGTGKSASIANAAVGMLEKLQSPVRPHIMYMKRVVGLPGERLQFTKSSIKCNGKTLDIPRDLSPLFSKFPSSPKYRFAGAAAFEVPDDSVFVISDNVAREMDSRTIGAVKIGNIVGRITR